MLRITPLIGETQQQTIKLEGKLVGPWVDELEHACQQHGGCVGGLTLDLSAVTFIDNAGLTLLQSLVARGLSLVSCSALVSELLRGASR